MKKTLLLFISLLFAIVSFAQEHGTGTILGSTKANGIDATSSNYASRDQDNVGTDLHVVRNDGNVGIGLVNPAYSLDVKPQTTGAIMSQFYNQPSGNGHYRISSLGTSPFFPMTETLSEEAGRGHVFWAKLDAGDDVLSTGNAVFEFRPTGGSGINTSVVNANLFMVGNAGSSVFLIDKSANIIFNASTFMGGTQPLETWDFLGNRSATENLLIRDEDVLNTGEKYDSPGLILRGVYDSDVTSGVTNSAFNSTIKTIVEDTVPFGRLAVSVNGSEYLSINESGGVIIPKTLNYFTDTSSVNDSYGINETLIAAYTTGMNFYMKVGVANTGAATVQFNALAAKTIKKLHDQDLITGDLEAGQMIHLIYDGTNLQMLSQLAQ